MDKDWYVVGLDQELAKTPGLRRDDVSLLGQWLLSQPHLPHLPDIELAIFLQVCQLNMEEAKKTLINNYTVRSTCCVFKDRDPTAKEISDSREAVEIYLSETLDKQGNLVVAGRLTNPDLSKFNSISFSKNFFMLVDSYQLEHGYCLGMVVVVDVHNVSFRHILAVNLNVARQILNYMEYGITMKIKEIHVINAKGRIISLILSLLKHLISGHLLDLFQFHSGVEGVTEIDPQLLPDEYGGTAGSFSSLSGEQHKKLMTYKGYFEQEELLRIDETKRPQPPRTKYFGFF